MPSFIFNTCCGCIELRTGCLIIGYLNLIGQIIFIIMGILGLIGGGVVVAHGESKDQEAGAGIIAVAVILLLVFLFLLAFTIVLLVGIHKDKRGHVKAYLIVSTILLALAFIVTLAGLTNGFQATDLFSKIISYLLSIYFLLVIRSYYYKMDDKRPPMYNTA